MFGQKISALYCAMVIFALISLFLSGCADREELEESRRQQAPGYNAEANEALEKAENAMAEAEVDVKFKELGNLTNLLAFLPDPLQIRQLEKQQKLEEAIGSFNVALDAVGASSAARAPARALMLTPGGVSDTDLALLHLHVAYCYVLAAVSQLARAGIGPDGIPNSVDDLYYISFSEDLEAENVYAFELKDRGQELIDAVDPDVDPYGYIKVFYNEGQVEALQAIIDSLLIILGAEVAVLANPAEGIGAHKPMVNRQIYRSNALYHLEQALKLAWKIAPGVVDGLDEFDEVITEEFSKELLENAIEWGFEIRSVPKRYEHLLEKN